MVESGSMVAGHGYEFGGPLGAAGMTIGLPFACYLAAFVCNDVSGCPAPALLHPWKLTLDTLKQDVGWPGLDGLINTKTVLATALYYGASFALYALLPAEETQGTVLRSGARLTYRLNTFNTALTMLAILAAGTLAQGADFGVWTFIWENYIPFLSTSIIISYALATAVYVKSFSVKVGGKDKTRELAPGGNSGNIIYDWFMGREMNPPIKVPFIGTVDIKSFMELRPGMIGWIILNLASMARQYHNHGYITDSMVIVVLSQAIYVLDALWSEPAILTTMDITTDGFGLMLSFGDLVWVPFTYALQARYLAVHPVNLGLWGCVGIFAVQGLGYYIFRASNNEKNRFRTDPNDPRVAHLKYIETAAGSRLITSGWWGTARHINYLGDWVMSWSYCLPTGIAGYVIQRSSPFSFSTPKDGAYIRNDHSLTGGVEVVPGEARGWGMLITYFFMLYFAILLIHRERRDEEKCRRKYGKDWDTYCKIVKWRILPGIY